MEALLIYHTIALTVAVILDRIVGDPHFLPHPVRFIGFLIALFEKGFLEKTDDSANAGAKSDGPDKREYTKKERSEFRKGVLLCILVILISTGIVAGLLYVSYRIHFLFGMGVEVILSCYFLAAKSLCVESKKVYQSLKNNDLEGARRNLSMIVGRDTKDLNKEQIIKASVETVSENTSDGVTAPFLFLAFFGPVGGVFYKAVNTMDSMIGYRNERYEYFGKTAAKLDDILNYLPSRISALMMIASCALLRITSKEYLPKEAARIWKRDRRKHKSPNSAQTESACAGALGLKLGGDHLYGGKVVKKPEIGDGIKAADTEDILRSHRLMYVTEDLIWLCFVILSTGMILLFQQ